MTAKPPSLPETVKVPYDIPADNGGSQLEVWIIISALSSPQILASPINYFNSFGFSNEFLNIHIGGAQLANLGDGKGWVGEIAVMRADYGVVNLGAGIESLVGGNHFRYWRQVTTGALFLAASVELWAGQHHNIIPNGYDAGRDQVAHNIGSESTSFDGVHYVTTAEYVGGLLKPGTDGINHNISIDGKVLVLTATQVA